jgi:hypothetical protein
MHAGIPSLGPADMQAPGGQVDVVPSQCRHQAKFGNLWLREGDNARIAATHGAPSAYREYLKSDPVAVPALGSAMARVLTIREVVQISTARLVFRAPSRGPPGAGSAIKGRSYLREEGGVRLVAAYDMPAKFYEVLRPQSTA